MTNETIIDWTEESTFRCYCGGILKRFNEKYWCSQCGRLVDFDNFDTYSKTTDKKL